MRRSRFLFFLFWVTFLPFAGAWLFDPAISWQSRFSPSAILITSRDELPDRAISWGYTAALSGFGALLVSAFVFFLIRGWNKSKTPALRARAAHPFPFWGWIAGLCLLFFWALAWIRLEDFRALNHLAFSLIWFSYIVLINALAKFRKGECLLLNSPRLLAALYLASIPFWWYFEYLNRFVFNWYYLFNKHSGPLQYQLFGSIAFGTVLPAVISTYDFLMTFPVLRLGFDEHAKIKVRAPFILSSLLFAAASLVLFLLPAFPEQLFLFLWIAPLLILVSLQALFQEKQIFSPVAEGNYSALIASALAALICGSLWELWNVYSMPKWIYSVPFVNHLKLFEMPLVGYMGYLPFGMECLAVYLLISDYAGKRKDEKTFGNR